FISAGLKKVQEGCNPVILRKGIDKATAICVDNLKEISKPISSSEEIAQVASISAANEDIGNLIANAIDIVGKDGVVTVEESKTMSTTLETVKGMEIDRGFISNYFADNLEKMETVLTNPIVYVTGDKISYASEIIGALEYAANNARSLLIIAEDVEGEALSTLITNKLRGSLNVVAIKAPGFGERRTALLEDIAILTGGKVISSDLTNGFNPQYLGSANSIKITRESTTILEGHSNVDLLNARVTQLKNFIANATSEFDRENLEKRLAKLAGGVAVIKVGAATETDMKEKKLRIEDALNATKAAIEEGIVAGGGCALIALHDRLYSEIMQEQNNELRKGMDIICDSLKTPLKQILDNAGLNSTPILNKVMELQTQDIYSGYNAYTESYVNMLEDGVLDPVKVTRSALQNASSIAGVFITTEAAVVKINNNDSVNNIPVF
ncbi:MAG: chaperonin GroEL, partial [Paraclostridium sp.]